MEGGVLGHFIPLHFCQWPALGPTLREVDREVTDMTQGGGFHTTPWGPASQPRPAQSTGLLPSPKATWRGSQVNITEGFQEVGPCSP